MNLFVYGELCRAETIVGVLGRMPVCVPALLPDHVRELDPATGYYMARPAAGKQIVGLLFGEISAVEIGLLDEFEEVAQGLYQRVERQAQSVGRADRQFAAQVYLRPGSDTHSGVEPVPASPGREETT